MIFIAKPILAQREVFKIFLKRWSMLYYSEKKSDFYTKRKLLMHVSD